MSNSQPFFRDSTDSGGNWFQSKMDSDHLNIDHIDDIKDLFDLVNNDSLISEMDLQEFLNHDGLLYEENKLDNLIFNHNDNNSCNSQLYYNDIHKQQILENTNIYNNQEVLYNNLEVSTDNYMNDPANDCIQAAQHIYTSPEMLIDTGANTDDKSEQQRNLMEQLLHRFQQDSSSAELILQLLELAKATGNKKNSLTTKQEFTNMDMDTTHSNQINNEYDNNSTNKLEAKQKLIKIEKKHVPVQVQIVAKPSQPKSQIILKNVSTPQPTQKIIVHQIVSSSSPMQVPAQQFIITTDTATVPAPSITNAKNLTVEDLQKLLQMKNNTSNMENNKVREPQKKTMGCNIATSFPIQVIEGNEKVAISRLSSMPVHRGERKTTHNAIEKKYRLSINNRLEELRELLDGKDSKLNKSSILRKAIENIRYLRNANHRLVNEVKYLKQLIGHNNTDIELMAPQLDSDLMCDYPTSANSHLDSTSYSSDDGFPSSPETTIDDSVYLSQKVSPNMVPTYSNKSQYLLSFFFIIMFFINPVALMLGSSSFMPGFGSSQEDAGLMGQRTLLSAEEDMVPHNRTSMWLRWISIWSANIICTLLIFARLTMFSEPVFSSDSKVSTSFWRAQTQADVSIEKGDFDEGERQLLSSLSLLGRHQPHSSLAVLVSLLWNILRQFLHRMHIGNWLESKAGDQVWRRSQSVCSVKASAHLAALVYIKLLRLNFIKTPSLNRAFAMNLALSTVNMAEAAGEALPKTLLSEAYILLALTMRSILPTFLHSYIQFALHQTISELPLHPQLAWLHSTEGLNFIFDQPLVSHDFSSIYSTSPKKQGIALSCMSRLYTEHLQQQTLASIIIAIGLPVKQYQEAMVDVKQYSTLLCKYTQKLHAESKEGEEKARWWSSALEMAVLLPDQYENLACRRLDKLPPELHNCPLALCISSIFRMKEMLLRHEEEEEDGELLSKLQQLSRQAGSWLKQSFSYKEEVYSRLCITESWQLLACDWLLTLESDVVQLGAERRASEDQLLRFQDLLSLLRRLVVRIRIAGPKLVLHETTLRLMAGANPVKTFHLFERSLKTTSSHQEGNENECEEMSGEEARSVLVGLRSLPMQLHNAHQTSPLLNAATSTFVKLGDGRSASMCRKLMLRTSV